MITRESRRTVISRTVPENACCPFCKAAKRFVSIVAKAKYAIVCDNCGAIGPPGCNLAEAWHNWNKCSVEPN